MKELAVSMLEVLCEEIHPKTKENVEKLVKDNFIDVISLHQTMVDCYALRRISDAETARKAHDTAIKTHNLLKHMEDFEGIKTG